VEIHTTLFLSVLSLTFGISTLWCFDAVGWAVVARVERLDATVTVQVLGGTGLMESKAVAAAEEEEECN